MKLCIPSKGSLLRLTSDWTFTIQKEHVYGSRELIHLVACQKTEMKQKQYGGKEVSYYQPNPNTTITLPAGTVLRFVGATQNGIRKRKWHKERQKDYVALTIFEHSMPTEPIRHYSSPYRSIQKRKSIPQITFLADSDDFNNIEFEFDI